MEKSEKTTNRITIKGITFKTGGNILFEDSDQDLYFLAEGSALDSYNGMLENGMALFLKKIKL